MKLSLEELRAQRDLVRRHLSWIEAKIAALDASTKPEGQADETAPPVPDEPATAREAEPAVPNLPIPGESSLRVQTASQVKRAQVGCLLLFIGACALFLFLLFGLPYIIDTEDASDTDVPQLPEELMDAAERRVPAGS